MIAQAAPSQRRHRNAQWHDPHCSWPSPRRSARIALARLLQWLRRQRGKALRVPPRCLWLTSVWSPPKGRRLTPPAQLPPRLLRRSGGYKDTPRALLRCWPTAELSPRSESTWTDSARSPPQPKQRCGGRVHRRLHPRGHRARPAAARYPPRGSTRIALTQPVLRLWSRCETSHSSPLHRWQLRTVWSLPSESTRTASAPLAPQQQRWCAAAPWDPHSRLWLRAERSPP
mmetsp:Transcript_122747/g.319211  ORF Transcript_122747/g.319211 Transcript_122747/m.319211 type:complete len:229 (+) Transcript_122747:142-828(+)